MIGDLQPEAGVSTETEGNVGGGLSMDIECLRFDEDGSIEIRVAIERYTASADGAPPTQTELRATHVYRREDGHWRAVDRHADRRPPDRAAN